MSSTDPIEAAIEAMDAVVNAVTTQLYRSEIEAAVRAAAPILIKAGRMSRESEIRAWVRSVGKANPWLLEGDAS